METDFKSDEDARTGLDRGFVTSIDFFCGNKIEYSGMVDFSVFVKFNFMGVYFILISLN